MPRARLPLLALLLLAPAAWAGPGAPTGGPGRVGEVRLSERAAIALSAAPGDTIEASADARFPAPERYRVVDVYRPRADPGEVGRDSRYAYFHADDLERLAGQPDRVERVVVWLRDPGHADAVRARLDGAAFGFDAYTSRDLAAHSSTTFVVIARFQAAIAWLALAAGAVFLVTLMTLKVQERKRELATLTLTGISRRTILAALVLESLAVALVGGGLGVGLGLVFSSGVNAYFRQYYRTDLVFSRVSGSVAATALAVALPLGVVAAAFAAWSVLRARSLVRGAR